MKKEIPITEHEKLECIEFPFGGYHFHDEYCEYLKSHRWITIFTEGGGIMEQCKSCKCLMQHASGVINFRFGCSIIKS